MSKRGRPRKSEVDQFSAQVWAAAIQIQSGGLTPYKIETTYMPEECVPKKEGRIVRPALMDRYARGELSPKNDGRRCGGKKLVERLEAAYPGSAKWLSLPLWELMSLKPYSLNDIHQMMAPLQGPFFYKFFSRTTSPGKIYLRNFLVDLKEVQRIARHETLDAFTFLLGLAREAEHTLDVRVHYHACLGMRALFPAMAQVPELAPIAGRIFDYLENTFFRVIYPDSDGGE